MPPQWKKERGSAFSMQFLARGGMRFYGRVEKLPAAGWDWIIWRAGAAAFAARYGRSATARAAMSEADIILGQVLARLRDDSARPRGYLAE